MSINGHPLKRGTDDGELSEKRLSTFDVVNSLSQFIDTYFRGAARVRSSYVHGCPIIFDRPSLAFMIKTVLREVAIKSVCEISFETTDGEFLIHFYADGELLSDAPAKRRIESAACEYGVRLAFDESRITLGVPTLEKALLKLYERTAKTFYHSLVDAFKL